MHKIIIQIAAKPNFVATIIDSECTIHFIEDHQHFYKLMTEIQITKESLLLINRGPGSYSGIRVALAYALGLTHGGLVHSDNIKYFTTFDLAYTLTDKDLFLKAWPRVGGTVETIKGYTRQDKKITYQQLKDVPTSTRVLFESNDSMADDSLKSYATFDLRDFITSDKLKLFAENTVLFSTDDKPLYINPVHITKQ